MSDPEIINHSPVPKKKKSDYTEDWSEIVSYSYSPSEEFVEDPKDENRIVEVVVKERGLFGKVFKKEMSYRDAKKYREDNERDYHVSIYDEWKGDNT